ncbi:MAG: peptide chain release factor-like protein [Phycisphaerae bacterium]
MVKFPVTEAKAEALRRRMEKCGVCEADLEESFVRSSGPGGQKVNKTSSAVRLLHRPSGTEVRCDKERSQGLNRYYARKFLCDRLEQGILGDGSEKNLRAEKIRRQKQRRRRRAKNTGTYENTQ